MSDCLFCRIVAGEIPADVVHADDDLIAFRDVAPKAPVHVLVIPRKHVASLADAGEEDGALLGRLLAATSDVARELGVGDAFRVAVNSGAGAGQSVFHLHLHVLGGRPFDWPPG